jgi:hypothetical protein
VEKVYPHTGNFKSAPTGENYLTFDSGGIKHEFESYYSFPNRSEAWRNFRANLKKYKQNTVGTLYWRLPPIMRSFQDDVGPGWYDTITDEYNNPVFGGTVFTVRARLLISDKPIIQSHDWNENELKEAN